MPHLLSILTDLSERGVSFRSLTEQMDTGTLHGELLFSLFGAFAQYERALTRERIMAGLAAARRRGRHGGRPPSIDAEKLEQITAALAGGASKSSISRTFNVPRSTLTDTLNRVGWACQAGRENLKTEELANRSQQWFFADIAASQRQRCEVGRGIF